PICTPPAAAATAAGGGPGCTWRRRPTAARTTIAGRCEHAPCKQVSLCVEDRRRRCPGAGPWARLARPPTMDEPPEAPLSPVFPQDRSEEHTSELQSRENLVC